MNTPAPHPEHTHSAHSPPVSGHDASACTCSKGSSPPHPGQFPSGCVIAVPPTTPSLLFTAPYVTYCVVHGETPQSSACTSVISLDLCPACRWVGGLGGRPGWNARGPWADGRLGRLAA